MVNKMTVDELLRELMKIKEAYPDSGKFLVKFIDYEYNDYLDIDKIRKLEAQEVVIIK
jgi:hypothetical protein